MINKSFQLIRTNPLLTTNFKVVVSSDYSIYLESFNTNSELDNVKYKHFSLYKNDYLENKLPIFYDKLPIDLAFDVRYKNDNNIIQTKYEYQFDTTYYAGAGYIEDQWHKEEFEYLAPLYIRKNSLPKGFVILRVDDPNSYNLNSSNLIYELDNLNKDNFKNSVLNNWKCINFFDMTYTSDLGKWLYKNYSNNNRFPKMAFEYNPEISEFSSWYGMDYVSGIYTHRPQFIEDRNEIETPHFRFEKFITEGYKRNEIIFPYILNLKFLFDDTPATPTSLRKYSINRYYGFYADDFEFVSTITSYRCQEMRKDTYLLNNIILLSGYTDDFDSCNLDNIYNIPSINPFVKNWNDSDDNYVFIDNTSDFYRTKTISGLYSIKRVEIDNSWVYKVISDDVMDDYWNNQYFQNFISEFGHSNIKTVDIIYKNYNILSGLTNQFFIDRYVDCDLETKYMYGDLYLIKIDNNYHVIKYSSGITYSSSNTNNKNELIIDNSGNVNNYQYYIQSDYAINLNSSYIEYWISGKNSEHYKKLNVISSDKHPLTFPIYRIKFSDIKDFDYDRLNTNYSDFDYEKTEYVDTPEEKLHVNDYNYNCIPYQKKLEKIGTTSQYKISNVSSEYIADDELYEIYSIGQQSSITINYGGDDKLYDLSDIWRKNQSIVKWGFMGSISHSDYPYKLNNSYNFGGPYNKTIDPFSTTPSAVSKNLDYFYRIGNFYNSDGYVYYKNQTTNIQYDFISTTMDKGFDLKAYFGDNNKIKFDYFTFFFKNNMYCEDKYIYTKKYDKYSIFNCGDQYTPSVTLFKGLKIKLREIKNIYTSNDIITKILYGNKTYDDYKCSIILNENYLNTNSGIVNNKYIDTQSNGINIILNEKYKNLLIIINTNMSGNTYINDIDAFDEKDGLYYGKKRNNTIIDNYNPYLFTAANFIGAINDYNNDYGLYVKYYLIREVDNYLYTGSTTLKSNINSNMDSIPGWSYKFQPFMINIEYPINILLKDNCYSTMPYYVNNVQNDNVATIINFSDSALSKSTIFRFFGPYEPIFKDINIFKYSYFCYNYDPITSLVFSQSQSNSSIVTERLGLPDAYGNNQWSNLDSICSTDNKYVQVNVTPNTYGITNTLLLRGFDFNIPGNAIITGITVNITRKSGSYLSNYLWTMDNEVRLTKDYESGFYSPSDQAYNKSYDQWTNILTTKTYPKDGSQYFTWGDDEHWNGNTMVGSDINSGKFGVMINTTICNMTKSYGILPQIKCCSVTINYKYNNIDYSGITTLYFDNNYKFDTSVDDFGKIDELVISKVNEEIDLLKDSPNKYNIYPALDEFGYDYLDRFIFKSSWDKEFFVKSTPKPPTIVEQTSYTTPFIAGGPVIETSGVTDITTNSAICGGDVISSGSTTTLRGICYALNPIVPTYPGVDDISTGVGSFTVSLSGLESGSTYNFKAYALNIFGLSYGNNAQFNTNGVPVVTTKSTVDYPSISGGEITFVGNTETTGGTCWSLSQYPTITDGHTEDIFGLGIFSSSITGLTPGSRYYIRAYATNSYGTSYGNQIEFYYAIPD